MLKIDGIGEASGFLLQSPSNSTALLKVEEPVVPTSQGGPKSETPKRILLRAGILNAIRP
jgi:hypothetical protein